MKKIMLCVPVLALGLLTSGCGKEKVLECNMSDNSTGLGTEQSIKVTFGKDSVSKLELSMTMTVDEEYVDYMDTLVDGLKEEFSSMEEQKGITVSTDTKDNVISFDVVADVAKMDEEAMEALDFEGINEKLDDIDEAYEELKEEFEGQGYTCK